MQSNQAIMTECLVHHCHSLWCTKYCTKGDSWTCARPIAATTVTDSAAKKSTLAAYGQYALHTSDHANTDANSVMILQWPTFFDQWHCNYITQH